MEGGKPLVSAVILNYKDPGLTAKCVHRLLDSAREIGLQVEVVVVDNSATETATALRQMVPLEVKILENTINVGFAKANNQGIEISRGDYVLLLNNDAFVNGNTLKTGIEFLNRVSGVGIWAPRLCGEDGMTQVSCSRFPSLGSLAGEYLIKQNRDWYSDLVSWREPTRVQSVVGAFFLIPRSVIEKIGGLDEDYFFTMEDVDYCKRVTDAGLSVYYDPRCEVLHIGGASQGKRPWHADPFLHRVRVLYFRKHHGGLIGSVAYSIIMAGLTLRRLKGWFRSEHR